MKIRQRCVRWAWGLSALALMLGTIGWPGVPVASAGDAHVHQASSDALAMALAERYGFSAWPAVERIDFTFRVELPGGRVVERPWSWSPPEGLVTADFGTDAARTFSLDAIDETNRDDHAKFINDSYWLLFPFQLVWSTNTITDDGEAAMPISGEVGRKLTVIYPDKGGYTPGDVYELFLDPETGLIAEWNFRKGGGQAGRAMTWERPNELGGVTIQADHRGPVGSGFRLTFPLVAVDTADATHELIWDPDAVDRVGLELGPVPSD